MAVYAGTVYWIKDVQDRVAKKVQATNEIFCLVYGMSLPPLLLAARVHKGPLEKWPCGKEAELFLESFPNVRVSKVQIDLRKASSGSELMYNSSR